MGTPGADSLKKDASFDFAGDSPARLLFLTVSVTFRFFLSPRPGKPVRASVVTPPPAPSRPLLLPHVKNRKEGTAAAADRRTPGYSSYHARPARPCTQEEQQDLSDTGKGTFARDKMGAHYAHRGVRVEGPVGCPVEVFGLLPCDMLPVGGDQAATVGFEQQQQQQQQTPSAQLPRARTASARHLELMTVSGDSVDPILQPEANYRAEVTLFTAGPDAQGRRCRTPTTVPSPDDPVRTTTAYVCLAAACPPLPCATPSLKEMETPAR